MKPDYLEVRDWKCLEYCATKENCLYACGLLPPHEAENLEEKTIQSDNSTYPVRFVMKPGKVQAAPKEPAYA